MRRVWGYWASKCLRDRHIDSKCVKPARKTSVRMMFGNETKVSTRPAKTVVKKMLLYMHERRMQVLTYPRDASTNTRFDA